MFTLGKVSIDDRLPKLDCRSATINDGMLIVDDGKPIFNVRKPISYDWSENFDNLGKISSIVLDFAENAVKLWEL